MTGHNYAVSYLGECKYMLNEYWMINDHGVAEGMNTKKNIY